MFGVIAKSPKISSISGRAITNFSDFSNYSKIWLGIVIALLIFSLLIAAYFILNKKHK